MPSNSIRTYTTENKGEAKSLKYISDSLKDN